MNLTFLLSNMNQLFGFEHSHSPEFSNTEQLWGKGTGEWSWGRISWDRNSTFSWDRIFNLEVEIQFVHEVEFVH
jgi:hypothetical protein